jgi:hypothetical protein
MQYFHPSFCQCDEKYLKEAKVKLKYAILASKA